MLSRLLLGATAAVALVAAPHASAKPALTFTDVASDANGVNPQGFEGDAGTAGDIGTGPVSRPGADIVETSFEGYKDGYKVTVKLSAKPESGIIYRVNGATADCTIFWLQHSKFLDGSTASNLRTTCGGTANPLIEIKVTEAENTLVFDVPFAKLPAAVKKGAEITEIGVGTRQVTVAQGATAPQFDHSLAPAGYKIGS